MRGSALLAAVALSYAMGCGGDDQSTSTEIVCTGSASGPLGAGAGVTAGGSDDLSGASIKADMHATVPGSDVSIACADDIVPPGFVALGPAVQFGTEGTYSDRPFDLTLPYKTARLPEGAVRRHVRIVARRAGSQTSFFPAVTNRVLDDADPFKSRAHFRSGLLTTYQVVAEETAGQPESQQFGWSSIIGISMGGNAAMSIGLRHPDRFDSIADLGGEPGPSMVYSLSMVRDYLFGGFCTAADQAAGRGAIGTLCPSVSTKADQHEISADFEHMITQTGDGVGLTLNRSLYMKASRDLGRALSNPALYNPTNAYAPPGVDFAYFQEDAATRCANPKILKNFFDREFNPDGSKDVITFCDGNDGPRLGNAVFDPTIAPTDPAELLLAVDLDGDGKRGQGEPVITNAFEPFSDVGSDGLADEDEPGYDPVTNPDPNGDDYHYLRNPLGTEGNGTYDVGEPFEDVGLDGVAGTCQAGDTPPSGIADCYDFGEGNGRWDLSPNVDHWYQQDVGTRMGALSAEQRHHMSLWFDAGIRDFLNAGVSANAGVAGIMASYGAPFGVYDNFSVLAGGDDDNTYDFTTIPWADWPKDGFLRYGNPDATASQIDNGDGKHVGTATQIIYRAQTAFAWINQRWPDGDFDDTLESGKSLNNQMFTAPTTGRVTPYALFLPPGYDNPANAGRRYPVVYFLHGYGQEPGDLLALAAIVETNMLATTPLAQRFQKFIIVFVDGRCRPETDGVPVDPTGDACEQGTFYMDAPLGGTARMETNLLDLMSYIDTNYRTRPSSAAQVTP